MPWIFLLIAIVAEVVATSALKAADNFTRPGPVIVVVLGYICTFYALGQAFRTIDMGVAYAIWCGGGMLLLPVIGWLVFHQPLDLPAVIGIGLILAGVLVLSLFSTSTS